MVSSRGGLNSIFVKEVIVGISRFFDQRDGKAKTTEGEYKIPKNVNDIVSAFYYARTLNFQIKCRRNNSS